MTRLGLGVVAAVALSGLLVACDRDDPPPPPGQIEQPVAAAVSGERVFVASPGADGLKVLDLTIAGGAFVRAPNPLFALDVPAVRRPSTVHALPGEGERRGIVVVLSALDRQLRLVDADALVPLGRPVALPGRPVAVDHGPGGDVLFVAVAGPEGEDAPGAVVRVELTAAVQDAAAVVGVDDAVADTVTTTAIDARPGGLAVSDLADGLAIWISDVDAPEVLRLDEAGNLVDVVSTGEALARLLASPPVAAGASPLAQGRFVYGLTRLGDGMVALDADAGDVAAPQRIGEVVLPMRFPSRAVALAAVPRALVDVGTGDDTRRGLQVPLLVLVTLIDGRILYAHGERMVPVDVDGDFDANASVTMAPAANRVDADGNYLEALDRSAPQLETIANPQYEPGGTEPPRIPRVTLTPGVTRTRNWRILFQGEVPGQAPALGTVRVDGSEASVSPVSPPDDLADLVRSGDRLTITAWHGAQAPAGCSVYTDADPLAWTVASVDEATGALILEVRDGGPPLPTADCFSEAVVYRVRAGGFLVTATGIDEVWRLEPGETFEYAGERFVRTDPLIDGPEIRFTLSETQDPSAMADGAERRLRASSGLEPVLAVPDTSALGAAQATIPGQLAVFKADPAEYGTGRIFVPYAGPGYLISFDLRTRGTQRLHR